MPLNGLSVVAVSILKIPTDHLLVILTESVTTATRFVVKSHAIAERKGYQDLDPTIVEEETVEAETVV